MPLSPQDEGFVESLRALVAPAPDEFIATARDRFDFGRVADAEDREAAEYDNRFANADHKNLDQWDADAKKIRKKQKRPIVQWNRVHVSIQQVVNDGRQNKPAIQISPGDGGKPETAEYIKARIRHIEYEANADTAKDKSRDQQVTCGRAFSRVYTENIPGTLNENGKPKQRIRIEHIENPFSVVFDPGAKLYDRSDADWAFIVSLISKDKHKRDYGEKSVVNRLDFADAMRLAPDWIGIGDRGEMIQIAEYFEKEYRDEELLLLSSAMMPVWKSDLTEEQYSTFFKNGNIKARRMDKRPKIMQYVINGAEVLKTSEWIGSTIPIVPFWGREATVDGKRRTFSLTRAAISPQQLLNVYVSNLAELIGQMPKTPTFVPMGGIPSGHEEVYAGLHVTPRGYVYYQPYDEQNRPLSPPTRNAVEPPIQACVVGINQCIDGIKAAMGIYDAQLGAKSNETSGIGIERRRKQSEITNYHFPGNEARSNKYLGEILVEIIPKIDQAGSSYPVRDEKGKTYQVPIGTEHEDWKTGAMVTHDLMSGQYGVTVSEGPSSESARQEAEDRDTALVQADPNLMWVFGDIMLANDDSEGSQERAERMKQAIQMKTPGLIKEKGQQQQIPEQVKQQMAQMQEQLKTTEAFAQSLHQQIESKQPELQMEKYKVDEQEKTKRTLGLAAIDQADAIALLKEELGALKASHQRTHELAMQAHDQAHQASQQQSAQDAASLQQQQQAAADAQAPEEVQETE